MKLLTALLGLLYPPKCPFCGQVLERGEAGMCALCQGELPWTDGPGGPMAGWCAPCREDLPWTQPGDGKTVEGCDACLSPLWYRDGVREGVHRYKFNGGAAHAALFGELMAQCLSDRWDGGVDLVTWAPLHPKRRKQRGYDQAELLARRVGEAAALPVAPTLEKIRAAGEQSRLQSEEDRRANIAGAYRALPGLDLAGKRVVLVDDVVTTGSTLASCAQALREAGAVDVLCAAAARAR